MASQADPQRILDTALDLAEAQSWEAVRLHDIATVLDIPLAELRRHYAHKDAIAEAWFDRADQAMLAESNGPEFLQLAGRERLERAIMAWLNALYGHRRTTRGMLQHKCEPGQLHLQALGVIRIRRTAQWLLETTRRHPTHLRRVAEEGIIASILVATFAHWLRDDSADSERTRAHLHRRLRRAERTAHFLSGRGEVRRSKPRTTVDL